MTGVQTCALPIYYGNNEKAGVLAAALDQATEKLLDEGKSPSRKVNEIDDRGSHFWLSLFWAEALAAQSDDAELASVFGPIAEDLRNNAETIDKELLDAQGNAADLGGYYWPDEEKTSAVMRPSATFNKIIDALNRDFSLGLPHVYVPQVQLPNFQLPF